MTILHHGPIEHRPCPSNSAEVTTTVLKRVLARQIKTAKKEKQLSNAGMARWMHRRRATLDRLLDPEYDAVTLTYSRKRAFHRRL